MFYKEFSPPSATALRPVAGLGAAIAVALALSSPARAASDDEIKALRQQVQELTRRLDALSRQEAQKASPAPAAATVSAAPAPATGSPTLQAGPVSVTLGGFVELQVVNRSRNEAADWASQYNTLIPYPQSPNYNLSEFHLTERQSRVSALVQGPSSDSVAVEGYLESDFGAAPSNGNNNESTSFSPRVRAFYADYQRKDDGWYLLFGQNWSLATQNRQGITPRMELIPSTIDGQYVPGFNWTRVPQIRFVKSWGNEVAFGLSVENPAMLLTATTTASQTLQTTLGYAPFYSTQGASGAYAGSITTDQLPDVIAKLAFDPGWGHYEVFGLLRNFRDRNAELPSTTTTTFMHTNNSTSAGGGGASVLLPLIPKQLDFQASFLGGSGVGRYGSAQLPDATLNPNGSVTAIRGYSVLGTLTWHPSPDWTLYVSGGREHVDETDWVVASGGKNYGFGYGSPLFSNANCLIEASSGSCAANTSQITQASLGGWWKFYQGPIGNMQVGLQLTNVERNIYSGAGVAKGSFASPSTNLNLGLLSFRYYPFQH